MADADLIQAIRDDHEEIRELLATVATGGDAAAFERLARKIAVHETMEQEVVHLLTGRAPGGEPVAEARLDEEIRGARALQELVELGVDDPGFVDAFAAFRRDVLIHAEHEETEEHPKLVDSVDRDRLVALGEIFRSEEESRIDTSA